VVTTNHGPFQSDLGPLYRAVSDQVAVIAISQHLASTATGVRIAAVIHHGVDLDRFPLGAGGGGYAAFLGRMTPEKGVHVAVRAARTAGMPLLVAAKMSEPHEREYFDAQVRPLLGGDIEYVGEVGGPGKAAFLADAVALLNPIRWPEPFGMVMIEAGACGTPVVATAAGSAPEIVADGVSGYLCETETALDAALQAASDLDRRSCRAQIAKRFSSQKMVAAHARLYQELVVGRDLYRPGGDAWSGAPAQTLVEPAGGT
jgi:glycosyltransferase involved in cell wall biosynthesis